MNVGRDVWVGGVRFFLVGTCGFDSCKDVLMMRETGSGLFGSGLELDFCGSGHRARR